MRMIDAHAAQEIADKDLTAEEAGAVQHVLSHTPTIAAELIRPGYWEDEYGGKYANPKYRCSVCKEKALYKFEDNGPGNSREVQALSPRCPYCGAHLTNGRKENERADLHPL